MRDEAYGSASLIPCSIPLASEMHGCGDNYLAVRAAKQMVCAEFVLREEPLKLEGLQRPRGGGYTAGSRGWSPPRCEYRLPASWKRYGRPFCAFRLLAHGSLPQHDDAKALQFANFHKRDYYAPMVSRTRYKGILTINVPNIKGTRLFRNDDVQQKGLEIVHAALDTIRHSSLLDCSTASQLFHQDEMRGVGVRVPVRVRSTRTARYDTNSQSASHSAAIILETAAIILALHVAHDDRTPVQAGRSAVGRGVPLRSPLVPM